MHTRDSNGVSSWSYSVNHVSLSNLQHPFWVSVDLVLLQEKDKSKNGAPRRCSNSSRTDKRDQIAIEDAAQNFLSKLQSEVLSAPSGVSFAGKLIIPRVAGFIARSDIIPLRMAGAPCVVHSQSFAKPRQYFSADGVNCIDSRGLHDIFPAAAGGIIFQTRISARNVAEDLDLMEKHMRNRLSFSWLRTQISPKQTLVFVGNYLKYPGHGGTGAGHYSTATALGIDLVVLDKENCWLADPVHAHHRHAFIACDLSRDDKVHERIIKALRSYCGPIHGIVTFHESLQTQVAKAAQSLSLPSLAPSVLAVAADKYKTATAIGREVELVTSFADALRKLETTSLNFPLILKPCRGWGSEGVYKARDQAEFEATAPRMDEYSVAHGQRFLLESYCDGPEVDVNMVLHKGELLFAEIGDDTPKPGDETGCSSLDSVIFLEVGQIYPSALPSTEKNHLVRDVHEMLLKLGLHTGVFHIEARVQNSRMAYKTTSGGEVDLDYIHVPLNHSSPSTWLIEINARPPGITVSDPVELAYGIDYIGLAMLLALDDDRVRCLSQSFVQGAEHWHESITLPIDREGVFASEDIICDLRSRRPDLAEHIARGACYFRKGDMVPSPRLAGWIGHIIIFSRQSREHLLKISALVRENLRYQIDST